MTLDIYVETLTGKTTGFIVSHTRNSNPLNVQNDYNLIPEVITHLPNPGMSEPSPIACDLSYLIPIATQDLIL